MNVTPDFVPIVSETGEQVILNISVTADKPFNECLTCRFFRGGCSGPNLLEMENDRMWEFLELVRQLLGWSYSRVAEKTGMSATNVKKNLTGQVKSPEIGTVRLLARALVGDPSGKYPCALGKATAPKEESAKVQELEAENAELRRELYELRFRHDWLTRDWEFKRTRIETQDQMIKKLMEID